MHSPRKMGETTVRNRGWKRNALLCGVATVAIASAGFAEAAEAAKFDIAPQPLSTALAQFGVQSQHGVFADSAITERKVTQGVSGDKDAEVALNELLEGTGLSWRREGQAFIIVQGGSGDPQSGSAAGDGADGTVEALIVTAQKREEDIQDVPIAISAFTQEQLENSQVAGGPDLMTQVPNFTFTKTNFSSYSIQIRGIGTQAISATTDPAVAIAFNNTPFVRNRFFEQEFYDLQRVEVLRGPQGTLYGRNATAGVVNIISAKPSFGYEAKVSADVSNYSSTRLEGMINLPLVEDKVALRIAGAWTKREGFVTNEITGNPIDGRDLWSTRLSLRFSPTDRLDANLIWEHFEEDDDRLRSGKQLCKTHEVTEVAGFPTTHYQTLPEFGQSVVSSGVQASFSQGCIPNSLYSPESFQTPNGISLPYYVPLGMIFLPIAGGGLDPIDPYVSRTQSHDLRVIESTVDPEYNAETDVVELQVNFDLSDSLSLSSETAWATDFIFSTQDFNRFNTAPGAWRQPETGLGTREGVLLEGPVGGIFCDPQVGCADRLVAVDLSTAKSRHFSQEFRMASNYDGPFNFSLGANFLRYDTEDKYYVFINSLSLIAAISPYGNVGRPHPPYVSGVTDNSHCLANGMVYPDPDRIQEVTYCTYMDPNPIHSLNDQGHNYFLSRNPYKLISYAVFGETYYQVTDTLKVSAGLRWTVDKKEAPEIPSWVLASDSVGYPVVDVAEQEWREPTGRLTVDWKPDLAFTDETLLYASYAHGYKSGGANPPPAGPVAYCGNCGLNADVSDAKVSVTHPKTFEPEFVDAFEVGAKNTLLNGRLTLNTAAFYYDYQGYQISQIIDRSALNFNFDAEVWGLEIEADWRPLENLKLSFKGGYEDTRVADGEKAVDIMDRTAGNPDWVLVRPFPTYTANCIIPTWLFLGAGNTLVNLGGKGGGNPGGCEIAYSLNQDPVTLATYIANPPQSTVTGTHYGTIDYGAWNPDITHYPGWPEGVPLGMQYPGWNPETAPNHGEGIDKELGGNELPNAPHFTATITADYTVPLPSDWLMTLHTDLYYQSEAWTRIFNMEGYDKLKAYTNVNLAAIFTNEDAGWKVMAYVKNVFDRDSITGAFLNSDDTGLTTNVFLTEPRLYGLRVTKEWRGGSWWTGANPNHVGPFPLTVELGGQVQRHDAPYGEISPTFADSFSDALDPRQIENRDLDWGDGREVTLTYAMPNSPWRLSGGYRFGKTNGTDKLMASEPGGKVCNGPQYFCDKYGAVYGDDIYFIPNNFMSATTTNREEHSLIDFAVGRDFGLGSSESAFGSRLKAGVRYAEFESRTRLKLAGVPSWELPDEWIFKYPSQHDRYEADLQADREFKGWGPTLSWEASRALLGGQESGRLGLDWSLEAGVLFGKQKTRFTGEESAAYFTGPKYGSQVGDPVVTPAPESRSKTVTVPSFGAALGLSYEIQRIKVGAGYRWERYLDVLDAGYAERQDADRTIDGPYFKLSVGFGG
jgi:outer membrane receptor protein involved in Fe transport